MTSRDLAKIATGRLIADVARGLFASHGYEAVTMRMIAKATGMSTGAIFANYAGKEALFEACMGRPAPDLPSFLLKVAQWGTTDLAAEAMIMRGDLIGSEA